MTEALLKFRDAAGRIWVGAALMTLVRIEGTDTEVEVEEAMRIMDLKLTSVEVVVR